MYFAQTNSKIGIVYLIGEFMNFNRQMKHNHT